MSEVSVAPANKAKTEHKYSRHLVFALCIVLAGVVPFVVGAAVSVSSRNPVVHSGPSHDSLLPIPLAVVARAMPSDAEPGLMDHANDPHMV
jgi:hypothetical protein